MDWNAGEVKGAGELEYATVLLAAGAGAWFCNGVVHIQVPYTTRE